MAEDLRGPRLATPDDAAEQRDDHQVWVNNHRRLRELLGHLEALGEAALSADPRSARPR